MNREKAENQNILSQKLASPKIDISEKPLEQTSIILPSSDNKQNSNSLQNSASNIVQMNNNSNEKSINMSNEEINFTEFNPNTNRHMNDIIIPSDENENDNEEEIEINDIGTNQDPNLKN